MVPIRQLPTTAKGFFFIVVAAVSTLFREGQSFFSRWFSWTASKASPWPPSDPSQVVQIPKGRFAQSLIVFPPHQADSQNQRQHHGGKGRDAFHVRQEVIDSTSLYHVVFVSMDEKREEQPFSLFRSPSMQHAVEMCERCRECRHLFQCIGEVSLLKLDAEFFPFRGEYGCW